MDNFEAENFETETHSDELNNIFSDEIEDIDEVVWENKDLGQEIKTYLRLGRKKFSSFLRQTMQKNFTNIVYLTLDCPEFTPCSTRMDIPLEYITELKNQYPDNNFVVLIPIIGLNEETKIGKKLLIENREKTLNLEKTSISFDFFLQNKIINASVYKYPKNDTNIQVYGIYSSSFSFCKNVSEISRLQFLAPFIKSARIAIKKLKNDGFAPDIVHCENIPFFLGSEFESKLPYHIKVLQTIKDFTQIDIAKQEAFWAVINLADKSTMKKLCADSVIKKCVANLFNLHNTKRFYQMRDCLKFIYKNYYKFRKYIDKGEDIDENIIFNRLNARVLQIFPQIAYEEELYFHTMIYTLKKCDFWITTSKTYYNEIFENPKLSGKMFRQISKAKLKSGYVYFGKDMKNYPLKSRKIYESYDLENFRECREKNKIALLKELSSDRIKTNFIDPTLFKNEDVEIIGNLDSFYNAPILFVPMTTEIFAHGGDIAFNTVLKLFELHKNIQVIFTIKDGFKSNYIKSWIDFLKKDKYLNGKWIFIDGDINLPKFLAGSDMILLPRRANMTTPEHYLAMHYGCIPIISRNGILNDTISDIFDDINLGSGFKTKTSLLSDEDANELFLTPVIKALNIYQNNPSSWNLLIKNCLKQNTGWTFKILEKYNKIYKDLL